MHAVDAVFPVVSEYFPAGHAVHRDSWSSPVKPVWLENLPAAQSMQSVSVDEARVRPYLPAPQSMQSDTAVLAMFGWYLPATHEIHAAEVDDPVVASHFPTGQAVQSDTSLEPVVVTYLPAGHSAHPAV